MAIPDSVRLALPHEAKAIAEVQWRSWRADQLRCHLTQFIDLPQVEAAWATAILRPPLAQYRVLVAITSSVDDSPQVVGFAAIGPSDDADADPEDALVAEFVIDPDFRGRGHGSRLINAIVDTLRSDGFTRATWWAQSNDDILRALLASAGWLPDGAYQELGTPEDESVRVKMVRLHTAI